MMCPYICESEVQVLQEIYERNDEDLSMTQNLVITTNRMMECKRGGCAAWNWNLARCEYGKERHT